MSLFADFAGFWTPVLPAAEVGAEPVAIALAGTRLALFRGEGGLGAVVDRCPHRGAALSLGQVVEGHLECPFHGWRFDREGACTHVPFNPTVDRGRLGARAVPVREAMGLAWVFTGLEPQGEPVVPELAASPSVAWGFFYEDWATHWTRVMENMLDTPHVPFVHRATIGRGLRRVMRPDSVMNQELTDTAHGFAIRYDVDGTRSGLLEWVEPNGMVLHLSDKPGWTVRMHVWCVPTEEDHTRLLVAAGYDVGLWSRPAAALTFLNRRIVFEDRAVVESSQPVEVPSPKDEANVPTDKATLRFRTWYRRRLAAVAPSEP